ncbi:MAG TPA: hypothetical protein VL463_27720 [Kofleriaceae bacterium]|nr:hypothetical protein [Kofleriaceae bacterium]
MRALLLLLAGCSVYGSNGPDASIQTTCRALSERFDEAVARGPGTCEGDFDCALLGGMASASCNGSATIGRCEGNPIERNAPGYRDALTAATAFFEECGNTNVGQVFDCAPIVEVHCGASHRCSGAPEGSCFPQYPDASYPDAGVTDAAP